MTDFEQRSDLRVVAAKTALGVAMVSDAIAQIARGERNALLPADLKKIQEDMNKTAQQMIDLCGQLLKEIDADEH
ncbi:hypothetical protein [Komagataeibacter diospyri]|uniref:hypothetical protein n=1 Tax=Komagataeibacter diospyri TaxID=1932662 RepID=UPI00114426AD|nr:hypothetical protein [Komagataeibacter diospyri]